MEPVMVPEILHKLFTIYRSIKCTTIDLPQIFSTTYSVRKNPHRRASWKHAKTCITMFNVQMKKKWEKKKWENVNQKKKWNNIDTCCLSKARVERENNKRVYVECPEILCWKENYGNKYGILVYILHSIRNWRRG